MAQANPLQKPKKKAKVFDIDAAMADTIARSTPKDGKAFGINKGFGVYKDKNGKLTYKGTAFKGAPQGVPGKDTAANDTQAKVDALGKGKLTDIAGYYRSLAGLLQGIGPGIRQAYSDTAGDIAGFGKGFSDDFQGRMEAQQAEAAAQLGASTGNNLTPGTAAKAAGFDPSSAADIGYGLGAYLPAKSQAEAGAAFGAAADFLPGAAAQQGLYALNAEHQTELEAAAKAAGPDGQPKASASLSKALGYLVDAYGQPILSKNGKPIPLSEPGLTPYQQAQIDATKDRESRYVDNEQYDRWKDQQNWKDKDADRSAKIQADMAKGQTIDASVSRVRGHVVYKDGTEPRVNGKFIPVAKTAGESTPQTKAKANFQKAVGAANSPALKGSPLAGEVPGTFIAKPGHGHYDKFTKQYITSDPNEAKSDGYSWDEAIIYLKQRFDITTATAVRALKAARWQQPPKKAKTGLGDRPDRMH